MKIDATKKYRTKSGLPARVLPEIMKREKYNRIVLVEIRPNEEYLYLYDETGKISPSYSDCPYDLVEVSEFDGLKIDDKVLVRDFADGKWRHRYYAGNKAGKILTFRNGGTSWSNSDYSEAPMSWNYWKLPGDES